jgi:hypothetical protein
MNDFDGLNTESSTPAFKPPTMFQINFERMIKDMRFVGMFSIIYGAITCLTIIGAIIGIPIIFVGMRMREAADQFSIFKLSNDAAAMRQGFELQGRFFKIIKILIIVGLILTIIYIVLLVIFLASGIGTLLQMEDYSTY